LGSSVVVGVGSSEQFGGVSLTTTVLTVFKTSVDRVDLLRLLVVEERFVRRDLWCLSRSASSDVCFGRVVCVDRIVCRIISCRIVSLSDHLLSYRIVFGSSLSYRIVFGSSLSYRIGTLRRVESDRWKSLVTVRWRRLGRSLVPDGRSSRL
jgi:hypothetical protein